MTIDWTKPIEHIDGTPLVLSRIEPSPSVHGAYSLEREDGDYFIPEQRSGRRGSVGVLVVNSDGWLWCGGSRTPLVRNRAVAESCLNAESSTIDWAEHSQSALRAEITQLKADRDTAQAEAATLRDVLEDLMACLYEAGSCPRVHANRGSALDDAYEAAIAALKQPDPVEYVWELANASTDARGFHEALTARGFVVIAKRED